MDKSITYSITCTVETFLGSYECKVLHDNISLSDWETFKSNLEIKKTPYIEVSLWGCTSGIDEKTEAFFTQFTVFDKIRKYKRKNRY